MNTGYFEMTPPLKFCERAKYSV